MGPVSGLLWLAGAAVAVVGWFLPGVSHHHAGLFWALAAITFLYSIGCITRVVPWHRVGIGGHAVAVLALQPLIVVALWLTGGADAYLAPVLVLPMLYVAYFFPIRYAAPLAVVEIATYASPLVTSSGGHQLVGRVIAYAIAYVGVVATIQFLKRRLVAAEVHQRTMAHEDPLTGLANRRAFDAALTGALAAGGTGGMRFVVLLADIDAFKQINDRFGHTTGDRVLREIAAHASAVVRSGDCLARIGGDELALVAPGAGVKAAERLAGALREAAAQVDAGAGPVSLTVSWAVYPEDGTDRAALLGSLDRELHEGKARSRAQRTA